MFGGEGDDTITGGAGNDRIFYTNQFDGHDLIIGFDGNPIGGQDVLDLDALFDSLGVKTEDRAGRISIVDKGAQSTSWSISTAALSRTHYSSPR